MMKNLKRAISMILTALLVLTAVAGAAFAETADTPFSLWNPEAPALKTLVAYVEAVTDEASPDYIPPEDRIATFDMDGTLVGELFPTYIEVRLFEERIMRDPTYQPDEEMLEFARMTREHAPDKSLPSDYDYTFSQHQGKAFAGMTTNEFADFIKRYLVQEADGFEGMTYAEAYYKPMAEVVKYLRDNGFNCYVVSGTDRFVVRTILDGMLDIPTENVIGSDTALAAKDQGDIDGGEYEFTDKDTLVRTDRVVVKDLKANKVVQIAQEIGKQPVLSFGNSSGDVSMHNYALYNNKYRSAVFQLIADDDVRDYGKSEKGPELREQWERMGFNVISMADDWKTIYGENVIKTGEFHWMEDYADSNRTPAEAGSDDEKAYTLDKMVVLSRHNIRSPLSGSGSLLGDITPHEWFEWTSNPSELSLRGAMLETMMGQYFRMWLEKQGLFPENYRPGDGAVRFYANAMQRTRATAHYFSAGLLPVADVPVEQHAEYGTMDPIFNPALTYISEAYMKAVQDQIAEKGGVAGMKGIHASLLDAIGLLMDVTDMEQSEAYQAGTYGNLLEDDSTVILEQGKEAGMTGPIKTATSVADALTFQFYEMADDKAAAFGHDLTIDDWRKLHTIVDTYTDMLFATPLIAVNAAHPLLQEIRAELTAEGRQFSFLCGHDSNIASVLSALGVEEYLLPETVEQKTPIGVKLVFSRWLNEDGAAYYTVELVYQSTEQLRGMVPLSLDNPPMRYAVHFDGVPENEDGMIAEADLLKLLDSSIDAYDALAATYGSDEALEPAA